MYKSLTAVAMAVLLATSVAASEKADVMSVVHEWVDAANKGDMKTFVALCARQSTLVDDFPPFVWQGPDGCAKWWSDNQALAKAEALTDEKVILGKPLRLSVTGDHAYLITRDDFIFAAKGKRMKETGAIHTFVLQKSASGWRVSSETWASATEPVPAE
jgi:ketosteroid isomerase-like protein